MAENEFSESPCESSFSEGTLLGHYRLEWFIARSTTGELYSAIDVESGKSCYLNIVSPTITRHASDLAVRLLRKGQEVCLLRHKNLVSLLDTFSFEGGHCIVTECFSGEFATERLLRGALPEEQVLDIARQLVSLLAEAENSKFTTFVPDFTPDSLVLGNRGEVKIFYPGVNRLLHLLPGEVIMHERRFLEGASFIAPELLTGKSTPGVKSAIYSLGMLLAACLCGGVPRKGNNPSAAMAAALKAPVCDISTLAPHVSPGTVNLIRRMTAKAPAERITLSELLKALGERGISPKTLRIAASAAVGLLLLGAVGSGLFFMFRSSARQNEEMLRNLDDFSMPVAKKESPKPAPEKQAAPQEPEKVTSAPVPVEAPPTPVAKESSRDLMHKKVPRFLFKSLEEQLTYCRQRVQQLESELAAGLVAPGQVNLIRSRIDFRKGQILTLSARRDLIESRRNAVRKNLHTPLNSKVKREVGVYLSNFTERNQLFTHRARAGRGEAQWMNADLFRKGVDYSMPIALPGAVQEYLRTQTPGTHKARPLGLLLLDGILLPEAVGAKLLARAEAPLPGLQFRHIINAFRKETPDKNTLRYLVRELGVEQSRSFPLSLASGAGVQFPFAEQLLREFLLNGGFPGNTALHMAVSGDNPSTAIVRLLLNAEMPLEFSLRDKMTPLAYAYMSGVPEIIQLLLEAGADSDHRDATGKKPRDYESYGRLAAAVRNNDPAGVQKALKTGVDVDLLNWKGTTLLMESIRKNKIEVCRLLLEAGADPNKYSRSGYSVLHSLLFAGKINPEMVKLLLTKKADFAKPLSTHHNTGTFMKYLCMNFPHQSGAAEAAEALFEAGKAETDPRYLLHVCEVRAVPLFRVLVKKWPNLNDPALKELFPKAMQKRMPADILKTLVERNAQNVHDTELLKVIRENPDPRVRALLTEDEEKPRKASSAPENVQNNVNDRFGVAVFNPEIREKITRAILREDRAELEELLSNGLSPDANVNGKTLLESAVLKNSVPLISLLLKYKADPRKGADTPLILAVKEGKTVAFSALIKAVQPDRNTCFDLIWQIMRKDDAVSYLRPCFEQHGKRLRSFDFCILTEALKSMASEQVLVECINFYKRFEAPKHRAVIHQALASRYRTAVIKTLLSRGADAKGRAQILLRPNKNVGGKLFRVSALEAADMVKANRATVMLLRQYGAK